MFFTIFTIDIIQFAQNVPLYIWLRPISKESGSSLLIPIDECRRHQQRLFYKNEFSIFLTMLLFSVKRVKGTLDPNI